MNKIILFGHSGSGNHGCEAIVRATIKILENCHNISLYSSSVDQDEKYAIDKIKIHNQSLKLKRGSIEHIFLALWRRMFTKSILYPKTVMKPFINNIQSNAVYLSVGGDHYCYGGVANKLFGFLNKSIRNKKSKTILWSCSIEEKGLDESTILDLNRYSLITARESITYQNLLDKGIKNNLRLYPDVAFILEKVELPLPDGFIENNTIGLNISPMIMSYEHNNGATIANYTSLIQYIIETTNCQIALIPHVVWEDNDDRKPLQKLYQKFKESGRVIMIDDHNSMELKGYIARCRMFIGARTHATIAAYSSCIPTLVIGYSVKAKGIAKDIFGTYDNYVIPVQSLQHEDDLTRAFQWLYDNEHDIRKYLQYFMPSYIEKTWQAGDEVMKIMGKLSLLKTSES